MKKFMALFLTMIMLIGVITIAPISANAEENAIPENAITLPVDSTPVQGEFVSADDVNYFTFTLETAGLVCLDIYKSDEEYKQSNERYRVNVKILKEDMKTVEWKYDTKVWTSPTSDWYDYQPFDSGTYYVELSASEAYSYNICCNADLCGDVAEAAKEPNNKFSQAKTVAENQVVSGVLSSEDVVDIYSFTLEKRQKLTLFKDIYLYNDPSGDVPPNLEIKIYQGKYYSKCQNEYTRCRHAYWQKDKDGKEWDEVDDYLLNPGTYYISFNYEDMSYEDIYVFKYELSDPEPSFAYEYEDCQFDEMGETKLRLIIGNKIDLGVDDGYRNLRVLDGEVAKWKNETPKKIIVNKKGRVRALAEGYGYVTAVLTNGKEIKCTIEVIDNPEFTYKYKPVTYVSVKKGASKKIGIKGRYYKIDNVYKGNSFVKVTGKANADSFKITGLKKGVSAIKAKVNRNWYKLIVNVK